MHTWKMRVHRCQNCADHEIGVRAMTTVGKTISKRTRTETYPPTHSSAVAALTRSSPGDRVLSALLYHKSTHFALWSEQAAPLHSRTWEPLLWRTYRPR